jgi:hypothetical protein
MRETQACANPNGSATFTSENSLLAARPDAASHGDKVLNTNAPGTLAASLLLQGFTRAIIASATKPAGRTA